MQIKTYITEMSQMIQATSQMINSFKYNSLAYYCEELAYNIEMLHTINELKEELKKAKQIKDGN